MSMSHTIFAAGCFWGIQAVFDAVQGVVATTAGYTGGLLPNPSYENVCSGDTGHAEAVLINYDDSIISFDELLLWVKTNFPEKREFFILDSSDSCLTDKENRLEECEVLYRTQQETARVEEYTVYHIEIGK